jgi:hypothetical protein
VVHHQVDDQLQRATSDLGPVTDRDAERDVPAAGTVVTEMNTPERPPTFDDVNDSTPAAAAITATIRDQTLGW